MSVPPLYPAGSAAESRNLSARIQNNYVLGLDCATMDGIFGNKTKAGVIAFQQANGLVADGTIDIGVSSGRHIVECVEANSVSGDH